MVGRALSERVKKQKQRRALNAKYQGAVEGYLVEQQKPEGQRQSLRKVADKHGVCPRTLGNPAEERVLVDFILESADRGIPLPVKNIRLHADAILAGREMPDTPVSDAWTGRFLDRHREELQTHWSSPLATERAKSLNPEAVKDWFDLLTRVHSVW